MVKDMKFILDGYDHFPGSTVQGKVMVSVEEPKPYNSIVVSLWGGAKVHWSESSGSGNDRRTTSFYNTDTFVHLQAIVWKVENSPTGDLPIGEHYFPFSFQLPQNILSSYEGYHGQIKYEVEAKIVQHGLFKFNRSVTAALTVRGAPSGINIQLYSEPAAIQKAKNVNFLCFISGSVSAALSMPRTGFSPGETLPISVNVSNESSKPVRVASVLQRKDTVTSSGGNTNILFHTVSRTLSSPIAPGLITTYKDENLMLPAEIPLTIRNCSCISVEYLLEIIIRIPWSFNLSLKMPIVIAEPRGPQSQPHVGYQAPPAPFGFAPQPTSQPPFGLPPQALQPPYFQPQAGPVVAQHPHASLTTQDPPPYNQAISYR